MHKKIFAIYQSTQWIMLHKIFVLAGVCPMSGLFALPGVSKKLYKINQAELEIHNINQ